MKVIRFILRIILFPIRIVLSLLEFLLIQLIGISAGILYLIMVLVLIGTIGAFIHGDTRTGIQGLVLSYLFSPYGLPLIGAFVIVPISLVKEAIKSI